jgi:pimeloyl-ACP methyl ester carboxylesterase
MSAREVKTLFVDLAEAGEDGVRLDRWFRRRWPQLTQIQIQKLARSGQIRVDGARAKADTRLQAGQQVRVPPLPDAPTVLLFHGNGETVADYDLAAPPYARHGMNLAVVDYRGYGRSDGEPSLRAILEDAPSALSALREAALLIVAAHALNEILFDHRRGPFA